MDAATIVILGASGDLTSRLLLPGLGTYLTTRPDRRVAVVGSAEGDVPGWEHVVRDAFASVGANGPAVDHAVASTRYVRADATSAEDLAALLRDVEGPANLYFALPPAVTERSCAALARIDLPADLTLALEKPIGTDLASARRLNEALARLVPEHRAFRVDHFLGLPGVLGLIGLRFANRIVEPVWNREHVESIEITFDEALGLEGRAGFYDATGAARDMIQSHLLQVMAILMMEPPSRFDDVELPANTAVILRAARLWGAGGTDAVVRGRYTAGEVDGAAMPAYAAEPGVNPSRETETFVQVTLQVDTWRWNGVPVTLRSGKALATGRQDIRVTFKRPPHDYDELPGLSPPNVLCTNFEDGHVQLELNTGGPLDPGGLSRLTLSSTTPDPTLTAYGSVVRWILEGNSSLTVRGDGAEQGWRITEDVLAAYAHVPLLEYPAGSTGPTYQHSTSTL